MAIFTPVAYSRKYCLLHPWTVIAHKFRDIVLGREQTRGIAIEIYGILIIGSYQLSPKCLMNI